QCARVHGARTDWLCDYELVFWVRVRRCAARSCLDAQRLVSRDGLSAVRTPVDALVSAKGVGHKNVHLEHLALPGCNRDSAPGGLPCPPWLAALFFCPGSDLLRLRLFALVRATRHSAVGWVAGGRRDRRLIAGPGVARGF